jgi:hypothetical protein
MRIVRPLLYVAVVMALLLLPGAAGARVTAKTAVTCAKARAAQKKARSAKARRAAARRTATLCRIAVTAKRKPKTSPPPPTTTDPAPAPAPEPTPTPTTTEPAPEPTPTPAPTYAWSFDGLTTFAGCTEHGLVCPGMDNWDVPQWPEMQNGQTRTVDPLAYGVPARAGGTNSRVFRATVNVAQRDAGAFAAYLYKVWALSSPETSWENEFTHQPYERMTRGQEGGTYSAWYYLPESTHTTLQSNNDATHGWINIFQFKHSNPDMRGPGHWDQTPQWWVNIANNDPNHIVLAVSHEGAPAFGYRNGPNSSNLPTVPFGRWFEIRAEVRPGNRIDFYLDGQRFETGYQSDSPVGLNSGDSSWIYSVGWYLNTGTAYIDDASFNRQPAGW